MEKKDNVSPLDANLVENDDIYYDYKDFVSYLEQRHETEEQILTCIQRGNLDRLRRITAQANPDTSHIYTKRSTIKNIRNIQNICITTNSIALRAALKGGLPVIIGYQLSNSFAVRIEKSQSHGYLQRLMAEINETYCKYVNQYANSHYSRLTRKAIDYTLYHITSHLQVKDIAASLYTNPSYLSRVFKRDTGQNLLTFINREKIKQAQILIRSHKYTLTEIAGMTGYKSYPNFAKVFKDITGENPRDISKST